MMITSIFKWLKSNLTATQVVCFGLGIFLVLLGLGLNWSDLKSGDFHAGMLEVQDWIIFGIGVLFVLLGVVKNGTKKRHDEIIKRLDKLERIVNKK